MAKNRSRRVTVALALTKWKVSVVTAKVFRAAGVVAVARDQRRNQRKRFEAWRLTTVQEKNAHGRKVRFAYARRAGRALQCAREGFREWERLCMENKNMVAQFRVARDRRFFVLVFRAWRTEARDAKAEKRAESIVSRRRDARALKVKSDAVFEWHAVARTHALAKTIGAAIKAAAAQAKEAIKARDTADAAATQTRREEAKQQAARVRAGCETRAARFAARREVVLRNAVFLAWRALVADVARARLGVDTAWRRHCSRLCAVSFDKWCVNTARARLVRRSCRAISKRRGFRTKRDVFRYWLVHTKAQRKSLRVLVSCLVRRTRCVLVDTWRVWVVQVRETKRFTRTLEKFSNEKSAKLRHEIFKRWRFRSVATATAKKQTLREARAFDKISLRRIVRLKKEALRAWLHGCRDAIRENKVLTRRANRRSDKLCARFFFTWRDVCRASRRETYLVAKLAKRWARVSLVTRFERWRASVSENARHVRFVVSLKKKKRERVLCLAFQTWRTRVSETRREEYLVSKIAKRRAKASLSSAFCVWCSVTTQSKRDAQFIETQSKRDRCLMAKIAKRWARVSLARAFGFWRCRSVAIREHAFVTKKHDRLVSKITTRFVRSVLNYWLVVVTHHKAQRVFAMNVAARWIEDTKGEYFYGWRSLVTGVRRARAALKCLDNKRAFVVTKERFQTWRVWGTKASSLRRRTYAVIARAKHRVFAKAWKGWFRVIERARELDSAVVGRVAHFARRVRRRHARQAFLSLKRNCQLTLHARDAAYVLIQHWHRRRVAVRFRKWRDVVYRGAYTRALSRTALQRRWQSIGRCAFAAWRARVRRVQSFAKKCDVADVKFHAARRKLNAKSWAVWVKFAISQIQAKRCVDKEQFDWMRAATESERAQKQKLVSDLERAKRFATDLSSQMEEIRLECVKLRSIAEIRNAESTELKQAVLDKDTALAKLLAERDVVRGWREGGLLLQGHGDGVDTINKKPKRKALGWADAVGTGVVGEAADVIFGDETDLTTREPWSPPAMHGAYKDRHTPDDNIEHDAKTAGSDHSEKETEDEDDDSDAKEVHYDDESADLNSPELIPLQTNSAAGDVEHFSSPPASASGGSRLDRALRLGAAASCMVTRRTKVFSSKKSETNETARTATPNATRRVPTATPTGGTTAAPRRVSSSSKTPKTPRFETPKSLSEKEGGVFKTGDPSFFTASALKQEAYVARHNKQDEGLTRGSVKTTPTTYANVRPFAAGLDSQSSARAVFQVECENPALCDALEIHLNRGGVIFRKTHGFDKVFFEGVDEGNKEGAELDTCNASALGRAAMETAAPMADATRGGSDATLFVVGAAGGGKTVWADATCASLAARLLAVASHKNQRLARLERIASDANLSMLNNSPGASSVSGTKSVPSMTTKVCLRVCVYETKGLAVTDLLAEHGGNVSLRLWPRALGAVVPISGQLDVSGGGQVSHTTHRASTHEPGLAYEVEDGLTKCLIGSAEDAARVLRAARRRRCDTSHKKSLPADSCVTEFWVETVTTVTSAAFGVRSRVSRSARARVVDVHDGHEGKGNSNSATFALAQCAGRLALNASHDEGDDAFESKAKKTIDWRQSALLKLAKGALCGEDFVSVAVAFGASAAQAESAQTGLRFASAVRRRNWGRYAPAVPSLVGNAVRSDEAQRESLADDNGTDLVSSATRVTRTVDETVSRRDSLARKLAATRVEARRNIR